MKSSKPVRRYVVVFYHYRDGEYNYRNNTAQDFDTADEAMAAAVEVRNKLKPVDPPYRNVPKNFVWAEYFDEMDEEEYLRMAL